MFDGEDDTYDPDRHVVRINLTPGTRLRNMPNTIPTEKVEARERLPHPAHYIDNAGGEQDSTLTC